MAIVAELVALRHGRTARHLRVLDHPALERVLEGTIQPEAAALLPGTDS